MYGIEAILKTQILPSGFISPSRHRATTSFENLKSLDLWSPTTFHLDFILDDGGLLRDVEPIKELPDVLVLHGGGLLDQGSRLRDSVDGVA